MRQSATPFSFVSLGAFAPSWLRRRRGFTLVELLVVVAILALLIAIMLPSLARARERAKATRCLANLHSIGQGLVVYETQNNGFVVPSYNMPHPPSYQANAGDVVDGWAAILDRDGVVAGSNGPTRNIFYCPNTLDIDGMAGGQTGYDQNEPSGYQDWPIQFTAAGGDGATKTDPVLPIDGFGDSSGPYLHLIRCGYWLNAQNPIGTNPAGGAGPPPCPYYTQSVGYGSYAGGGCFGPVKSATFVRPGALIVACDGMYMGRQSVTRLGEQNRRIGYRHPGQGLTTTVNGAVMTFTQTVTNAVFADGHAEPIENGSFPHGNVAAENAGAYSLNAGQ